jgi:gamma-glutamylcyclotransferase (GGCT)/AIG2-like uncharacterized protein YtfP
LGTFLNFAYGSNMSSARLRARTPSARVVAIGELEGHSLRWHKRGEDGSGKCDAYPVASERMWGVVYEIDASEKPALDAAEGLHHGYEEKWVEVTTAEGVVTAQLYVASDSDPTVRPYDWYKAFVVHGAIEHGLPADYVEKLRRVEAATDPDRDRARRNRRILG